VFILYTPQFYAQYVQYISQLHVAAHFRPSSGCSKYSDIIIRQNTTQFCAQYVQYISQLHVSAQPEDGLKWAEICSCGVYCIHCV